MLVPSLGNKFFLGCEFLCVSLSHCPDMLHRAQPIQTADDVIKPMPKSLALAAFALALLGDTPNFGTLAWLHFLVGFSEFDWFNIGSGARGVKSAVVGRLVGRLSFGVWLTLGCLLRREHGRSILEWV